MFYFEIANLDLTGKILDLQLWEKTSISNIRRIIRRRRRHLIRPRSNLSEIPQKCSRDVTKLVFVSALRAAPNVPIPITAASFTESHGKSMECRDLNDSATVSVEMLHKSLTDVPDTFVDPSKLPSYTMG